MLLASAKAVYLGHQINPDFQIGLMIANILFYPETCNPNDAIAEMEMARDFKDFYYDVQCRGYYPSYKLKELESVTDTTTYTITFYLTKEDSEWKLQDISDQDREKIHGLYEG